MKKRSWIKIVAMFFFVFALGTVDGVCIGKEIYGSSVALVYGFVVGVIIGIFGVLLEDK